MSFFYPSDEVFHHPTPHRVDKPPRKANGGEPSLRRAAEILDLAFSLGGGTEGVEMKPGRRIQYEPPILYGSFQSHRDYVRF